MKQLIMTLSHKLIERQWQMVTAESCTGGGLAYHLTDFPGSSAWFERGFVTYSPISKEECLAVQHSTLEKWGAVSEEVVREMAEGALRHSRAEVSVAITGVAGPSDGGPQKPVGTMWLAWAGKQKETQASHYLLHGHRQDIREQAIRIAIERLLIFIRP